MFLNRTTKINQKKRILFVEGNQDGTVGGSHHSLLHLVKALDKKTYEAIVMFYENTKMINQFHLEDCDIIVFKKPTGKNFYPPMSILKIPFLIIRKAYNLTFTSLIPFIKFLSFIIKNKIDLVHLNNTASSGWEWLLAAKLLNRKCIVHQRGFSNFNYIAVERAKFFDKIMCISRAIEKHLQNNNISNTQVIYNAIDVDEFRSRLNRDRRSIREEFGIKDSVPLIGVIANFQEWKGHLTVINAMDILRQSYYDVVCLLIGAVSTIKQDIEYFTRITKEIRNKGLEKNVIITGYRQDIPDLINSLDILVHSSIEPEPFGRVLIEGMCLEKAVIATDIGGPREIIENGVSGILVSPSDPDALSYKIEYLLDHTDFRQEIGNEALKRVKERFSLKKFSAEINLLYDEIIHK
jgi:glycosyltransferase involved in cell wall biosynthesis